MNSQNKTDSISSTSKAGKCAGMNGDVKNGTNNVLFAEFNDIRALNRFNILVAKEVIPYFAGDCKELVPFLAVVGLLNDSMRPDDKQTLLDYVYFVKLSAEVRLAVSIPNKPNNFEELKSSLSRRYKELKPSNYIQKLEEELHNMTQRDLSVLEFREQLLQVHDKLANERFKHIKDERVKQHELKELADEVLDRFKFGGNFPFNAQLHGCKTLDDAVETALYLESAAVLDGMNRADSYHALVRAGFCPLGYGLPKIEKKQEPVKTQHQLKVINNSSVLTKTTAISSTSESSEGVEEPICLFGKKNYISVICKNARGPEPLKFYVRNISPYSIIKLSKVLERDIRFCRRSYAAPWCMGMEEIRSIGTIPLVMNLKPGVYLRFAFLVVEDCNYQMQTDGMIGFDFIDTYVDSMYPNKEVVIKHRGEFFHIPIELFTH